MEAVRIRKLQEYIALPDMRQRIIPLLLFKGSRKPHEMHALFNFACAMMLAECQDFREGSELYSSTEFGHWCGLHRKQLTTSALRGIFNRMKQCPEVTAIVPTLTEYIAWVWPRLFVLDPVPLISQDRRRFASWRIPAPYVVRIKKPKEKKIRLYRTPEVALQYPFVKDINHGDELVMAVHKMVPQNLPHEIRGDLCQDLLVAVLSGDCKIENLPDLLARYTTNAHKFMSNKWKHTSLDQPLSYDSDLTLKDILAAPQEEDEEDELEMCANHAH